MNGAIAKLQALGAALSAPHTSAVQGSEGAGLRELRPRGGRSRWRPLYRQLGPTTFVVLAVAPEAKIDKRGFDAAVRRAALRFAELEELTVTITTLLLAVDNADDIVEAGDEGCAPTP